ncbi:aldo/keto reductase [Cellulomonas sp. zg-ZUI22]|uniref:aldo/keto reductase n=1 Tax=Cellulomonas sp. zg-ZUI22 TaxID=2816955 RepID=UPI001A9491B6|nr:aldo/keto reductase [Cellulomonas sp. zg-ZUI22]MBO0901176.1 aldo/keto reductase [Cellulomonas sp. zg-ZUI22]
MQTRVLGRTGREVGVVGLGCWQLGGDWGVVADDTALSVLEAAVDAGVTFLDTADVYGDGRSERAIGQFLASRPDVAERVTVATKMGRRADPHEPAAYTYENFCRWTDRSRQNLRTDTLDLVQLHCPPTPVFRTEAVYDALDRIVEDGRAAAYGVSVETVDEALAAIERPHVASVQIILNVFRRKPLEQVLPAAVEAGIGIIARVPLASGLLTGRYDESTQFAADDHRTYNRNGEAFDVGETFAGVPYEVGVAAAREVAAITPSGMTTAQLALKWITQQPGVSVVIPGARTPGQAQANAATDAFPDLDDSTMAALERVYDDSVRPHVHGRW